FPDGHLPSPRWRWFAWVCGVVLVLASVSILVGAPTMADSGFPNVENPFAIPALEFLQLLIVLFPFCILGSAASLAVRYRRSRGLRDNPASLVLVGVTIGLAFWPLRKLATRIADRLVFGNRANPYEVLSEFSGRVGDAYAAEDVLPRMAQVLGMGIGADAAAVWLVTGGELHPVAVGPLDAEAPADVLVDVQHRGERLGALSVAMPPTEPLSGARENLV